MPLHATKMKSQRRITDYLRGLKPKYVAGENVLCYHGSLIYEAKCLKFEVRAKQTKYFIHYKGWNKSWDEWVPESRLLEYNADNLQRQKELKECILEEKECKVLLEKIAQKESGEVEKNALLKKLKPKIEKRESEAFKCVTTAPNTPFISTYKNEGREKSCQEEAFAKTVMDIEIKISLPVTLKNWLSEDWHLVTQIDMLLKLPARITVEHVVTNYVNQICSRTDYSKEKHGTSIVVARKLGILFDKLLEKELLYLFERQQFAEVKEEYPSQNMSQIYGAIHLVRMFTSLGSKISAICSLDEDASTIKTCLNDFTMFMSLNENFFSVNDYFVASQAYHRLTLSLIRSQNFNE